MESMKVDFSLPHLYPMLLSHTDVRFLWRDESLNKVPCKGQKNQTPVVLIQCKIYLNI